MCADPKMRAAFLAELKQELASRRAAKGTGLNAGRWQAIVLGAVVCIALIAVL